jgi:hypothetical protein
MNEQREEASDAERRIVRELIEEHVRVSSDILPIDEHTWAIHGSIAVDGEVILAEFHDTAEAQSVLGQHAAAEARELRTPGARRIP